MDGLYMLFEEPSAIIGVGILIIAVIIVVKLLLLDFIVGMITNRIINVLEERGVINIEEQKEHE